MEIAAPPLSNVIADDGHPLKPGSQVFITRKWNDWLRSLTTALQSAPQQPISPTTFPDQSASIGTTPLVTVANAGSYRVSWHLRITQAAGTSSDLSVTVTSTEGTQTCLQTGPVESGNTLATVQSGSVQVIPDQGTPISIGTTRVSVGAPAMHYTITFTVEALG